MTKRAHIPLETKLAAALACLLPQEQRNDLRRVRATARKVLSLFEWDHIHLFALGGDDHWSNLDPKRKAEHREKSRKDCAIAAKVKRLQAKNPPRPPLADNLIALLALDDRKVGTRVRKYIWPKGRKIASRPFPKRPKVRG